MALSTRSFWSRILTRGLLGILFLSALGTLSLLIGTMDAAFTRILLEAGVFFFIPTAVAAYAVTKT